MKKGKSNLRDKDIGARIRAFRVGAEISQTKLGEALGVSFQQIQKYETGTNRVSASNLAPIAKALGCSVADILEMGQTHDDPVLRMLGTSQGRHLAESFLKMAAESRAALLSVADKLAN